MPWGHPYIQESLAKADEIAALSPPAPAWRGIKGWQWVPIEPTEEMIEAAGDSLLEGADVVQADIYRAMLSAAPSPQEKGEG